MIQMVILCTSKVIVQLEKCCAITSVASFNNASSYIVVAYNNNNNNKKTSLAPISSENPSSVAQQNQRIRHSRDHVYNAKSRQPMDGGAKKLRRIGHFEKIGFQITTK